MRFVDMNPPSVRRLPIQSIRRSELPYGAIELLRGEANARHRVQEVRPVNFTAL